MTLADDHIAPIPTAEDVARGERRLAWSLRLFGGVDLLALIAFFMPMSWIQAGHELCGFGPFPEGPIPEYLARATSLLWAMHGGLLLVLSTDVRKYVELIGFVAIITVLAGLLLFLLARRTDLPLWWMLLEGPVFAATGLWYLSCLRRI